MNFVDIEFPRRIAFGAQSDPMWSTELTGTIAGWEDANQNWTQARHAYDVALAVRTASDYLLVRAHFHQVRGRANSFPFKDFLDHKVAQADGLLVEAGGNYQMHRQYGTGVSAWLRKITRPVSGTVKVWRTRSGTTTDATSDATITYSTGAVAMASHASGDTYAWSGEFMVPCRYDTDRLPSVVINKQPGAEGELLVQCQSIPIVEVRE